MALFMYDANLRKECNYIKIYLFKSYFLKSNFTMSPFDENQKELYKIKFKNYLILANEYLVDNPCTIFTTNFFPEKEIYKKCNRFVNVLAHRFHKDKFKIIFFKVFSINAKRFYLFSQITRIYTYLRPLGKQYYSKISGFESLFWPYTKFYDK